MVRCTLCNSSDHIIPMVVDYRTRDYYFVCQGCKTKIDKEISELVGACGVQKSVSGIALAFPEMKTPTQTPTQTPTKSPNPYPGVTVPPPPPAGVKPMAPAVVPVPLGPVNVIEVDGDDGGLSIETGGKTPKVRKS